MTTPQLLIVVGLLSLSAGVCLGLVLAALLHVAAGPDDEREDR